MSRIALPSLLAAAFSLISDVFADPNGDHAIENIKLMASFVQFLENLQRQGCDIRRLSEGFAKLLRISKSLIFNEQCILHEAVRVSCLIDMVNSVRISLIIL